MVARLILNLGAGALLLITSSPAEACRCRQLDLTEYFLAADVVAKARVVGVSDDRLDGEVDIRRYRVETIEAFKGQPVAEIHSYASSATCGVDFSPGQRLWLFAQSGPGTDHVPDDALWMNSCNGTRPASAGFIDAEVSQVAATLNRLARRFDETMQEQTPQGKDLPRLRQIPRGRIDAGARLALQRTAVVSPNGASRAAVIGSAPNARPPHAFRLLVEHDFSALSELRLHGRWRLEKLVWINDRLLFLAASKSGSKLEEWVLDIDREVLVYRSFSLLIQSEVLPHSVCLSARVARR